MRPARRRLVINADDLGLARGVNDGIFEAAAAGVVTSASMMVNTPGFDDAVARVQAQGAARLGVGLHFNLTAGAPVSPAARVPSLVDGAGRFAPLAALLRRALAGRLDAGELRREADAQLDRLRASGIAPTHADSHRHVHALPVVRGALESAAERAGVRVVRRPVEPPLARPWTAAGLARRAALGAAWYARGAGAHAGPAHFRGLGLLAGPRYAAQLLALLDALPAGTTELMVHPGRADPGISGWDTYIDERAIELAALLSAPVRARLARGDIELVAFDAV